MQASESERGKESESERVGRQKQRRERERERDVVADGGMYEPNSNVTNKMTEDRNHIA